MHRQHLLNGAFAVAYEDASGEPRRGIVGVCWDDDRLHGRGGFTGSAHVTRETDVWVTRGGYGTGYPPEAAAYGGWVTAAEAVAARAVDIQGQTLEDTVDDGVVLFMYAVRFNLRMARTELLDAAGQVILSGPM